MLEIEYEEELDLYKETVERLNRIGVLQNDKARVTALAEEIERYRQRLEEALARLEGEKKNNRSLQHTIELENEEIQYLNKEIDELRRVNGEYARKHLKPETQTGFPKIIFPSEYETDVVRIKKDDSIREITIYFKEDD